MMENMMVHVIVIEKSPEKGERKKKDRNIL